MFDKQDFKNKLFDRIAAYFDKKEDDEEAISGEEITLLRTISLLSLPESKGTLITIVTAIRDYVTLHPSKRVSEFVQQLYNETSSFRKIIESPLLRDKLTLQLDAIMDDDPVPKDAFIKVMMHCHRNEDPLYNGYLVSSDRTENTTSSRSQQPAEIGHPTTEALYERINHVINHSNDNRLQVIVRQIDHYTALDIDKEKGSCFIMDAAGDLRQYNLHELVKKSPLIHQVYYVEVETFKSPEGIEKQARLQHDECSCSTFALDHSFEVAKYMDIHEWLETNATTAEGQHNRHYVTWAQLHLGFVRNAQSPTFREYYKNQHPDEAESIGAYFEENSLDTTKKLFIDESMGMLNQLDETLLQQIVLDVTPESPIMEEDRKPFNRF